MGGEGLGERERWGNIGKGLLRGGRGVIKGWGRGY